MKYSIGNVKLGENCFVFSRPVGKTCPSTCEYLHNGCYAEQTEAMYPNVRPAGMKNVVTNKNKFRALFISAINEKKSIRFMERGDWFLNGKLDTKFIENVVWACESILKEGKTLPKMWFYTHIYDRRLAKLSKYMKAYASVHNIKTMRKAKKLGFVLFAWCDSEKAFSPKRPKRFDKRKDWKDAMPKLTIIDGEKFITCPEIRKGRDFVTCTGTKDTVACNMCIKGKASVLFPNH